MIPFSLTAADIQNLLQAQGWRCAVSKIPFTGNRSIDAGAGPDPFAPSFDRIRADLGYVFGNIRIVCTIVNFAMNKWGEGPLFALVAAMAEIAPPREHMRTYGSKSSPIPPASH